MISMFPLHCLFACTQCSLIFRVSEDLNRTVEGGSSFKRQRETNATIYNTRQEKQRAICDVSTRTCYSSGAIEKFVLLKRSATKKKQWDRGGRGGGGRILAGLYLFHLGYFLYHPFPSFTKWHSSPKVSLLSPPCHRLLLFGRLIQVSMLRNSWKINFHFERLSIDNLGEINKSLGSNQDSPSPPHPYCFPDVP